MRKAASLTPILAVGLILGAFLINLTGDKLIGAISNITVVIKIGGIQKHTLMYTVVLASIARR